MLPPGPGQPAGVCRGPRRSGRRWLGRGPGHSPGRWESSAAVIKRHLLLPLTPLSLWRFVQSPHGGGGILPSRCAVGGWVCGERDFGPRAQAALPLAGRLCRCPGVHGGRLGARRRPRGAAADGTGLPGAACLCLKRGPWGGACAHMCVCTAVVLMHGASGGFCTEANRFASCVSSPTGVTGLLCLVRPPAFGFLWEKQTPCRVSLR